MRRKTIALALALTATLPALAGGLLTNSNQNAAFLRSMAQDGQIDINSIYANPAGGAFLGDGWHLALNMQSAFQHRDITTTYAPFALNKVYDPASDTHLYKGKATAPVVPSFTLSYNRPKWSVSVHFALGGGGGKCEFDDGLGSFETAYAKLIGQSVTSTVQSTLMGLGLDNATAGALAQNALSGYDIGASYMKGRSYYYDLQVGGTYKFLDNLSGYVGLRAVIARCNYKGYVHPLSADYSVSIPMFGTTITQAGSVDISSYGIDMNCDQKGFGVTPIIGIDWMINKHWNVAAKYEAPTKIDLKNSTEMAADPLVLASAGDLLGQYMDGIKVREDVPGILTFGAQYTPIEPVRISAAFHEYFDKSAKKYDDKQKLIDHNTWELNASVEWDACRFVTASASWQTTQYGLSDAYMSDLSYNLPNNMIGFGVRLHPCDLMSIDLAYMHTIYSSRDVVSDGITTHYTRKNDVIGIGLNFNF